MQQCRLALLCLMLLITLCPARAQTSLPSCPAWYQPTPADFRAAYDRDIPDHRYQTWDGNDSYWYWVQAFYNGHMVRALGFRVKHIAGWTARVQGVTAAVAPSARPALVLAFNTLGRSLAIEWAKDDHVGHVSTGDLQRYGRELEAARRSDNGQGEAIRRAIERIQSEINQRLADAGRSRARSL